MELNERAGPQKAAARPARRPSLLFAGLALALLLAGAGGTYLAALALTAPAEEVQASPALPTYSAVGQVSGDLVFWPWRLYAEQAPTPYLRADQPVEYLRFLTPVLELLPPGGFSPTLPSAEQGGAFSFFRLEEDSSPFFLSATILKNIPLEGFLQDRPQSVLLDVAFGDYSNLHGVWENSAFTFQVRPAEGYDSLPRGWQQRDYEIVQRDLACLFGLTGDDPQLLLFLATDLAGAVRRSGNDRGGADLPDGSTGREYIPLATCYQDVRYMASCARNFVYSQCTPEQIRMSELPPSLEGVYEPLAVEPARIQALFGSDPERALQNLLDETYYPRSLDVQIVTLETCTAVLFIYDNSYYSFAVYYDPVLQCYSGMAAQYAF